MIQLKYNMIILDKNKNEKNNIIKLLKSAVNDHELELECLISDNSILNNSIKYNNFESILKRINNKKPFNNPIIQNKLNISFPLDSEYKNIRVIINGLGNINTYCNVEKIDPIINNIHFQGKSLVSDKLNKVYIPNYNLKFNLKKEVTYNKDDGIIRKLMKEWKDIPKCYRYKKTFSFIHQDDDFKLDLSIIKTSNNSDQYLTINEINKLNLFKNVTKPYEVTVPFKEWWNKISKDKSAKVLVKNVNMFYKNIKESRVFNNSPIYEVEVEYIKNKNADLIPKFKNFKEEENYLNLELKKYFKIIGILLQAIQHSFFIISNNQIKTVRKEISKFTGNRFNHTFFGPLAVDLTKSNMSFIDENSLSEDLITSNNNIKINYLVTDKADGDRLLLYIGSKGKCYGIMRDNTIRDLGLQLPDLEYSIFDGEYVDKTHDGKYLNNLYIFDCYLYKEKIIINKPFNYQKEDGRHYYIRLLNKYISTSENVIQSSNSYPLLIYAKIFYLSDTIKTYKKNSINPLIFDQIKKILGKINHNYGGLLDIGHMFDYATDGLIFIPNNLSVYQETTNDTIENHFITKRWNMNYKWKSHNKLSIDFKVEFQKNLNSNSINYIYKNNKKFVPVKLKTKFYQKSDNNQINQYLLNTGIQYNNIPVDFNFFPIDPFIGEISLDNEIINYADTCHLNLDSNDNPIASNGDIIIDNSTVEFIYDKSLPIENRWIPLRNRTDKSPNGFNTASDIWKLIFNPITIDEIINKKNDKISNLSSSNTNLNMNNNLQTMIYYKNNKYLTYKTTALKNFNNFVKSYLIERYLSNMTKPYVMDITCGKMGDFFKYVKNNVNLLIGLDINSDNIHNKYDGACTRILNNIHVSPKILKLANKTMIINADSSKNISTGEAGIDELNKYYLNVLYGNVKASKGKLLKMANSCLEGFNLITCMYSIHYFLDNENKLNTFLQNVSENLRDQGYFIGTFLDGYNLLKQFKGNNEFYGSVDDTIIYSVYKYKDMDYSNINIDNKVKMYFETFNNYIDENLVSIDFLEDRCKEYNLKLIESNLFLDEPGNLLVSYQNKNESDVEFINQNTDLLKWAKLNRYFIFQKVNNLYDE